MSLVSSQNIDTNRVELTVEVKGEQFKSAVETAVRKNLKKITIPGFRKGKAPRAMVEKVYGTGFFYEEAMNELYPKAYSEAADEAGIIPVDAAAVEIVNVDDEGFTFKATVTTKPEAKLGEYKGLTAPKAEVEITDAQVDEQIEQLRERNARVVAVEREAKDGDITEIDFEGFVDGVAFEGGKGENYPLTLGSNSFIPGFEEQVVGHKAGEEFDVVVTFPEEYGEASLAGKEAVFKIKLHEVKEKQMPTADDEFAKDVSEFDTVAEFKADIKKKLLENALEQANADFENKLLEQVVNTMEVEVPECMINSRVNELVQDFGMRMQQQGLSLQDFIRYTGETEEKFRETFRGQAENQVKGRLAMEAIAKAEGFVATEEEITAEYEKLSVAYNTDVEKLRGYIAEKDIAEDIACKKALELLSSTATATKLEVAVEDEMSDKKATVKKATVKKAGKKAEDEAEDAEKKSAKKTTKKAKTEE